MDTFFLICAIFGGTILLCQFGLTMLGLGGDHGDMGDGGGIDASGHDFSGDTSGGGQHDIGGHDNAGGEHATADGHHGTVWIFKVITFQTVVAAVAFFGLAGKAAIASQFDPMSAVFIAGAAGFGAMYGVYYLIRSMHRFNADGTVQIGRAVGLTGIVYIPVPRANEGCGKIQMNVQNRVVEFQAMTAQERLPSGIQIKVIKVIGPDTVEVERLIEMEKPSHV